MSFSVHNRLGLYFIAIAVLVLLGIYLAIKTFGVRINVSDSMPMGLYIIDHTSDERMIVRGDLVEVCLPHKVAVEGIAKGYIDAHGHCADGSGSLIKEVIALPVDHVQLTSSQIIVNQKAYYAPSHDISLSGIPITHFIKPGNNQRYGYWLYGANSPDYSWDSRYFGAVEADNIIHILKPLWIWSGAKAANQGDKRDKSDKGSQENKINRSGEQYAG
ncbi:conjugative transfer signal peptidase TraF [Cysteiniphilum sp. 6C5]|uniref:conjugative transfer signal peptidase TraF n=1 Tax=unclassified Cysteiniphilum TaxID=2610889 RepID=UPI003F869007